MQSGALEEARVTGLQQSSFPYRSMVSISEVNLVVCTVHKCLCWDRMDKVSSLMPQGWKSPFNVLTSVLD